MTDTRRARPLPRGGVELVLEQPQLVVAADERRLEPLVAAAATRSATTRSARQAGTGASLPLSRCSPAGS